jgi:hypothetical protein
MTLYLAVGFVLFCLAFARLAGVIDRRFEVALTLYLTLLAYVISFIRWETGTDWPMYIEMYGQVTSFSAAQSAAWWGPGYSYIAAVVNLLGGDYSVFLFCIATILFGVKFHLLRVTCKAPLVAVFVLFCTSFFDIFFVRQGVAATLFWAFTWYYYQRRYGRAFITGLLAFAFHYSAALPIAVVMLVGNFSWRRVLLVGVPALLAVYYITTQIDIGAAFSAAARVNDYINSGFTEQKDSSLSTTLRSYIKLSFWLFVIAAAYLSFLKHGDPEADEGWSTFCLRSATGIILCTAVLVPVSEIFARLPEYATALFAVVLANYRFRIARMSVGAVAYVASLLLLFVQLIFAYSAYPDLFYPIKTILG